MINFTEFVNSYLHTAAWVTCDTPDENHEFTKEAMERAIIDCAKFIGIVEFKFGKETAEEILTIPGSDLTYLAPHCFFLNRCGHGTGFWDREKEFGIFADYLSEISKSMGNVDVMHIRGPKSKLAIY